MKLHTPEARKARIEIIPMIDAIFFLLVFFMFSSLSMVRMKGANISLPSSKLAATPHAPGEKLVLTVTRNGDFYLNKTKIPASQIQEYLQPRLLASPNSALILNLAPNQTTQKLIDVLDAANKIKMPSGGPPVVLIASEAVDSSGRPLLSPSAASPRH